MVHLLHQSRDHSIYLVFKYMQGFALSGVRVLIFLVNGTNVMREEMFNVIFISGTSCQ